MVNVIASVKVKPGTRARFLEIFKVNMATVRKEKGCIEYFPAVDMAFDFPFQPPDENGVTIIEKWESLDALRDHLSAPHMAAYREKVGAMVERVDLKVLEEA